MSILLVRSRIRWWPGLGFPDYGLLWNILPDFDSTSAPKLSRRRESRIGQAQVGDRHREFGVDQQLLGQILANLPTGSGRNNHQFGRPSSEYCHPGLPRQSADEEIHTWFKTTTNGT